MKKELIGVIACVTFSGCTSEEAPSKQGQLLSIETIKTLDSYKTYQNKLISVEGYPAFCSKVVTSVRSNSPNKISVYAEPGCKGKELIDANILVDRGDIVVIGNKKRNCLSIAENSDFENIKMITDDYKNTSNEKVRLSGTLVYENGSYYLDKVTIHKLSL